MGPNTTLTNTELKKTTKKTPMPVFEQQESSSYASLVWTIVSTEVE